jgi:aspartyl/asparaginyl beta-hydroxylase (cupin superfamily)
MNQAALAGALDQAARLRGAGDRKAAVALLEQSLAADPRNVAAWNLLGIVQLELADPAAAAKSLEQAAALDAAPPVLVNLARARRALGDRSNELEALDRALAADAYYLPAILDKGEALIALGREPEALELYRLLCAGLPADAEVPPPLDQQLAKVRALLQRAGEQSMALFRGAIAEVAEKDAGSDLRRAQAYAEQRAGLRKVFQQQPTGGHFPYLPAIEFFDRSLFPWFDELESHTAEIREELAALWAQDQDVRFRPYVDYAPGTPLNQWAELNGSPRWSAWFFWENGVRNEENCARCPRTSAVLDRLPLLDISGKAPTVMYSILEPHTRIPAHTGTSNTRTTVHLPLIVPPGCAFRVGAETREWREGEAWAFDDTIEHEAWNDSDQRRGILIVDTWNPLLTEAEREVVRRIG